MACMWMAMVGIAAMVMEETMAFVPAARHHALHPSSLYSPSLSSRSSSFSCRRRGREGKAVEGHSMSLFPTGSGHAGAVERSEGRFEIFLPLPLDISDPFVKDTMTDRVPTKILGRTVKYNEKSLPRESLEAIDSLAEEMRSNKPISPLTHCPRYEEWNEYLGQNDLPWYVSETYVYHRLLEATGYFKVGSQGHEFDVFAAEKKEALEQALPQVDVRMQTCMQAKGQWSFTFFKSLLHMSLWGNQGDSSLFTAQDMSSKGTSDVEKSRLIVDDSSLSFFVLGCKDDPVVHIFNDNSGMELVSDLAFAHYVVSSKPASTVVLQLKPYPFFVSDATVRDVHFTIETLKQSNNANQRQVGSGEELAVAVEWVARSLQICSSTSRREELC
eukprot:763499-Hanusia_phi.AAC.2